MLTLKREACLIDGEWVRGDRWIDVHDPASGETIGRVPDLPASQIERAIAAAQRAMQEWSAQTSRHRSTILRRFFDLIVLNADPLASLLTSEQGKPLSEARSEIEYAAAFVQWYAEEANRAYGDVIPSHDAGKRLLVIQQPVGVVAAITPWNFPAAMVTRKIAPALAAGCGVVLKPSELTPFTALALGSLAKEAGLPEGLLNIVTGDPKMIGGRLTRSPVVRKLSFTGSTAVGAELYAQCAPTIKKLSLELGGNAPFIVFDDADLEAAVAGAIHSKFRNAGQTCVCTNRFFVQAGIHDAFVSKLVERVSQLQVAPGILPSCDIGPLIDARAVEKVRAHIADALSQGAAVAFGNLPIERPGNFFPPTILTNVNPQMRVAHEETFGPLAPIMKFEGEKEALVLANQTEGGLASYLFSRDLGRIWRVAEALETGMVGVNTGLLSTEVAPFGGIKMSGLGREGSRYGLSEYLETKYICMEVGRHTCLS